MAKRMDRYGDVAAKEMQSLSPVGYSTNRCAITWIITNHFFENYFST